ncbi:MAG TPA: 2-C-methyl-D-erythritol 4-phosphate cytidylyltransferase [Candidatus Angelobacter sp.]|nr:2-C-methyl-D-erythritol 4-phosphate cytidylyltransferase [Candidatus Angelobacter sp.]
MLICAILLAAGDGNRFGGEVPKQFLRLAGEEILLRSLRTLAAAEIDRLVVVAHPRWQAETERLVEKANLRIPIRVVAGGSSRNESTWNGILALDAADRDVVLVHDAVRPLLPLEVLRRAIDPVAAGDADSTDTVIPSADTLVVVEGGVVVEIPDRSRFRRGQTPQVFTVGVLKQAYEAAAAARDLTATDDCSLVLRHVPGAKILAVPGDEVNIKITTKLDLVLADRMLQMKTLADDDETGAVGAALHDARVLVVGGTNGIGRAIADEAERLGARAEVVGRSTGLDVRDRAAVGRCVDEIAERLGGLDHVIVTAGVLRIGRVADADPAELCEVIDVNLTGTLNVAAAAYRYLRESRGSLTVFASSSFTRGRAEYVAYSASKAAVVNLSQGLAEEWADEGIRVNAVSPERTDTPMRRRAFPDEAHALLLTAEEVARSTIRLLRSDLTGQVLDVRRHLDP